MSLTNFITQLGAAGVSRGPTDFGEEFGGGFYAGNIVVDGTEYFVILAPKSSGQSENVVRYTNSGPNLPSATHTLNDGPTASAAVNSSNYPAAYYCEGLSIGGFTDWYLPSRDELELCYRNLKPDTTSNRTDNRDKSSFTYPEGNDLSSDTQGINRNSNPAGSAYSSGTPSRTSITAFRTGGSEALRNDEYYWSSSANGDREIWVQFCGNGFQYNMYLENYSHHAVRAVRRVPV